MTTKTSTKVLSEAELDRWRWALLVIAGFHVLDRLRITLFEVEAKPRGIDVAWFSETIDYLEEAVKAGLDGSEVELATFNWRETPG